MAPPAPGPPIRDGLPDRRTLLVAAVLFGLTAVPTAVGMVAGSAFLTTASTQLSPAPRATRTPDGPLVIDRRVDPAAPAGPPLPAIAAPELPPASSGGSGGGTGTPMARARSGGGGRLRTNLNRGGASDAGSPATPPRTPLPVGVHPSVPPPLGVPPLGSSPSGQPPSVPPPSAMPPSVRPPGQSPPPRPPSARPARPGPSHWGPSCYPSWTRHSGARHVGWERNARSVPAPSRASVTDLRKARARSR